MSTGDFCRWGLSIAASWVVVSPAISGEAPSVGSLLHPLTKGKGKKNGLRSPFAPGR